jgi:hypothetical protein
LPAVKQLYEQLSSDRRYGVLGLAIGLVTLSLGCATWTLVGRIPVTQRRLLAATHWVGSGVVLAVALACFGMGLSFCGLLVYGQRETQARLRLRSAPPGTKRWQRLLPLDPSFRAATLGFAFNVLALLLFYWMF